MFDEIERFVNWIRRRNPQAHTWRDYRCDLQQLATTVGGRPPAQVTVQDVDHFVTLQAESGFTAATFNRRLAAVLSFYAFLADEDPDLVCPVLPHRHTLRSRRRLPRSVPEADLERFFAVVDDARDRAMFLLMLRCGPTSASAPLAAATSCSSVTSSMALDHCYPQAVDALPGGGWC